MRGLLVAACALLVVLVGVAGGAPKRFAEDRPLETIKVAAETSVVSDTSFQSSETYKLVFRGSVHNECKGDPFEEVSDEDAFWLYNFTDRRNPNPTSPAGGSFFDYTGAPATVAQQPAYSSTHTYTVVLRPPHVTGRIVFRDTRSSTQYCTRTGAWRITVYRVESGTTKTVSEPAPGGSTIVSSPSPLPEDRTVRTTVTSSDGDLKGTTVVGTGGRTTAQATGEAVTVCLLLGPDALGIEDVDIREALADPDLKAAWAKATPKGQLLACLALAEEILVASRNPQGVAQPGAACRVQRLTLVMTMRGGRVDSVRPVKRPLTPTSIKYSCTGKGSGVTITIDGRQKGGLRKALGPKLGLGVARAKSAPGPRAKLTFGYSF